MLHILLMLAALFGPPKPRSVGGTFTLAPDSTVNVTVSVTVRNTLQPGDQIRYQVKQDSTLVRNVVGAPYSMALTGIPAPAYGQTSVYTPCARVVYANGSQSALVCGTGWTYARPALPPPPATIDSVRITPASASVTNGQTFQFTVATNTGKPVSWRVVGQGTVSATGLYTAPL